jgi:hypothetical protein
MNNLSFSKLEAVEHFIIIYGLGRSNLHRIMKLPMIQFYQHIRLSESNLLVNMFWKFSDDLCLDDDKLLFSI